MEFHQAPVVREGELGNLKLSLPVSTLVGVSTAVSTLVGVSTALVGVSTVDRVADSLYRLYGVSPSNSLLLPLDVAVSCCRY